MNKLNKKFRAILAIAMMLTFGIQTLAENIEIDGIYYSTYESDKTASVISGTNKYSGEVIIPGSITYNDIEYTVTIINSYAFEGCSGMSKLSIPNTISKILYGTFDDCSSLSELIICDGSTTLDLGRSKNKIWNGSSNTYYGQFEFCSLKHIYFGRNVDWETNAGIYAETGKQNIVKGPFDTSNIETAEIGNYVTEIKSGLFYGKRALTSINIPNSVTKIGQSAFYGCSGLTSVTIPNSVTSIGGSAFNYCTNLASISLGNSVETIGASAFGSCNNLLDVKSFNPMPQNINANAFSSTTYTNAILTVPYKCNGIYAGRTGWGSFNTIIEMEMPSIYLTIKLPESGVITHKEVYDEVAELAFKANDGWQINTVSFNEDDITSQLDDEGNYTTPALTEDATLTVVFEKIPTGVEPLALTNDIKVYAKDGFVEIVGTDADSVVNIYDTMGISKYIGKDNRIYLEDNGIYILTVEGRTFKFAM